MISELFDNSYCDPQRVLIPESVKFLIHLYQGEKEEGYYDPLLFGWIAGYSINNGLINSEVASQIEVFTDYASDDAIMCGDDYQVVPVIKCPKCSNSMIARIMWQGSNGSQQLWPVEYKCPACKREIVFDRSGFINNPWEIDVEKEKQKERQKYNEPF